MTATAPPARSEHDLKTRIAGHPKGCRCEDGCVPLDARYKKQRLLAKHYGTWQPLTDAAPHLAVLHAYRDAAWTGPQIAAVTGLDYKLIRILLGEETGMPAPSKMRAATVNAVRRLAGASRLDTAVPDVTFIDPTGSRRQVQALAAIGWPQKPLEARGGWLRDVAYVQQITAASARRIDALYAGLRSTPGPSNSAAIRARNKGWATPNGWEDLDIGDPRTVPHDLTPRDRTPEEIVEDAEFIRRRDNATWQHTAERLEVDVDTLHTYRTRVRERVAASAASPTT